MVVDLIQITAIFFIINIFQFLSFYLANYKDQPKPFLFLTSKVKSTKDKLKSIYARNESDPFRSNMDYTILVLAACIYPSLGVAEWFNILSITLLSFGMIYLIYMSIMTFVFKRIADIKSDIALSKVGILVIRDKLWLAAIATLIMIISIIALSHFMHMTLMEIIVSSVATTRFFFATILSGILILGFFHFNSYHYPIRHHRTVISPVMHLVQNIKFSNRYKNILNKDENYFQSLNQYTDFHLDQKPNIIIIAVESYGSVLMQESTFQEPYKRILENFTDRIHHLGWHTTSHLSEPPIFAGGSWLSYSSFLYGIKINDVALYNLLFQNHDDFHQYESLLHYTRRTGYKNYLLCPIGGYDGKVDWKLIKQSYQSDHCFGFENIEYEGQTMSYINFGITPPDQYSLQYAYEHIKSEHQPYSLFFSTLNSHCFYDSPINTLDDWRAYQNQDFETTGASKENLAAKYLKAIHYQFDFIQNFIASEDPDNTIIVLVGDHQPPFVAKEKHGKETPLHILSKDKRFIDQWEHFGFKHGMSPANENKIALKHQGFYSLFMKALLSRYSPQETQDLKYDVNGISLD